MSEPWPGRAVMSGRAPADLGNAISDAINAALRRGMRVDEAVSVTVAVAADYGRGEYGNQFLKGLSRVVLDRKNEPLPEDRPNG